MNTMKQLNISGIFTIEEKTPIDSLLTSIKKDPNVHNYEDKNENNSNAKLKLGPDEHEFTFDLMIDNISVPVLIYLQLSLDGKTIETIESFTGINYFTNIKEYEHQIITLLNLSLKSDFKSEISVDAHASNQNIHSNLSTIEQL